MSQNDDTGDSEDDEVPKSISYRPRGRAINIVESDATAIDAVRDLFDNIVDALKRRAREGRELPDEVTAILEYDPEAEQITVKDNAYGGIEPHRLGEIPAMGASSNLQEGIGHFGVGGIRASVLGGRISYASSKRGFPPSEFTIDVEDLRADDTGDEEVFESERRQAEDLEEGWTRITIEGLNNGIDGLLRSAMEEIGKSLDDYTDEARDEGQEDNEDTDEDQDDNGEDESLFEVVELEPLKEALGRTYSRLLSGGIETATGPVPFSIELRHGEDEPIKVDPVDEPSLLRLPVDGLGPRRYEGVPFSEDTESENPPADVRADVEIGLKPKADMGTAGLYLSIQDRMVMYADKSSRLFTSQYLGNLRDSAGHGRLVIKVDLYEEISEDSKERTYLPINSQKNGIDYNSPITPHLLSFIGNAASPYKSQGYDSMPDWMLKAYSDEYLTEEQQNLLEQEVGIRIIDKKGAKTNAARTKPKPGTWEDRSRKYHERDTLRKIVETHAYLRIRMADPASYLADQMSIDGKKPQLLSIAYDHYFDVEYPKLVDGFEVSSEPTVVEEGPSLDWREMPRNMRDPNHSRDAAVPLVVDRLVSLAEEHAESSVQADPAVHFEEWEEPRYQEALEKQVDDATELDMLDSESQLREPEPDTEVDDSSSSSPPVASSSRDTTDDDVGAETPPNVETKMDQPVEPGLRIDIEEGLVLVVDGEPQVMDEEVFQDILSLLDCEPSSIDEFAEQLRQDLERKKELEKAAAIFQSTE